MTELTVKLETYSTFREATDRARELAMRHNDTTGVCRGNEGWDVMVSEFMEFAVEEFKKPRKREMWHGSDNLREELEDCADASGRIYLGDGIYI